MEMYDYIRVISLYYRYNKIHNSIINPQSAYGFLHTILIVVMYPVSEIQIMAYIPYILSHYINHDYVF